MDYILTSWVLMAMVRLASPIASEILEVFHFHSNGRVVWHIWQILWLSTGKDDYQSYFQVPIETRENWLDTADIVQVTFFTNSQQHLSLCLGDSSYRAIALLKRVQKFKRSAGTGAPGMLQGERPAWNWKLLKVWQSFSSQLEHRIIFISSFSRGTKVNLRNVERKLLTCPDIQVALMPDYKHCQTHYGPEGWVLSTKYQFKQNATS